MDIYKALFEKGNENYIKTLHQIGWFENPYINAEELKKEIRECTFQPYLATKLLQVSYVEESYGSEQVTAIFDALNEVLKDLQFEIKENAILLTLGEYSEQIEIDFEAFEVGEGEDSFVATVINPFLKKANMAYQFYELPPDDESASFIFVTPEKYTKALQVGLIPDFMGYFAVNY
jgi:hypothetical protein